MFRRGNVSFVDKLVKMHGWALTFWLNDKFARKTKAHRNTFRLPLLLQIRKFHSESNMNLWQWKLDSLLVKVLRCLVWETSTVAFIFNRHLNSAGLIKKDYENPLYLKRKTDYEVWFNGKWKPAKRIWFKMTQEFGEVRFSVEVIPYWFFWTIIVFMEHAFVVQ